MQCWTGGQLRDIEGGLVALVYFTGPCHPGATVFRARDPVPVVVLQYDEIQTSEQPGSFCIEEEY